jgi:uncharacterized protein with PIN domain
LRFHSDLPLFIKRAASNNALTRILKEKTSIKDVVEACGVPHPEVDLMLCDGIAVNFEYQLTSGALIDVYGVGDGPRGCGADRLQRRGVDAFIADGHLGKLTRDLRLLGIDVAYGRDADDRQLVDVAVSEQRALLTRDRRLLMHRRVCDGYFLRSQFAEEQAAEVIRRFNLADALRPYTRCLLCNGSLVGVTKSEVLARFEPLTRIHYDDFQRCAGCASIYWPGSHVTKLQTRIARIEGLLHPQPARDQTE